jgi:hypothetical protein
LWPLPFLGKDATPMPTSPTKIPTTTMTPMRTTWVIKTNEEKKDLFSVVFRISKCHSFLKSKINLSSSQWGCTTGNAATVAHSTKKPTSGKDSVIEGQPLLLFM